MGQIGLQFLSPHRSAFFSINLRWAPDDRKKLRGHLASFIENIHWEEHLLFVWKRGKTSKKWTLGTNGLKQFLKYRCPRFGGIRISRILRPKTLEISRSAVLPATRMNFYSNFKFSGVWKCHHKLSFFSLISGRANMILYYIYRIIVDVLSFRWYIKYLEKSLKSYFIKFLYETN